MLAIELQGLVAIGFDMEPTGFELGEIEVILDGAAEKTADADRAGDNLPDDDGSPAISRLGDVWQLSSHLLVRGDARDEAAYRAVLGDDKADVVVTDPPYNVKIDGHVSGLGATKHKEFAFASGEMSAPEFTAFLGSFLKATVAHLRPGIYIRDWAKLSRRAVWGIILDPWKSSARCA